MLDNLQVLRTAKADDTVINVTPQLKLGGGNFHIIAGPCSIESKEQTLEIAKAVADMGASIFRGGAFKPRTNPYDFQGLGIEGIRYLEAAAKETGLPIISEILDIQHILLFENIDIIQVGARNMQNYELLKELAKTGKTIMLKRSPAATVEELLLSAEHIYASAIGAPQIILCERGIRTFETSTRNTLDLSAIPVIKHASHLPVIVDPSHATGRSELVKPMALAAVAAGADGIMVEVHNNPCKALCDGRQSLNFEEFQDLVKGVLAIRGAI